MTWSIRSRLTVWYSFVMVVVLVMGAIVSLVYILGIALIWLAPETKGRPLPE